MRDILFRGRRKDNGEWVEGFYAIKGAGTEYEKHVICVSTFTPNGYPFYLTDYEVDPSTVGQDTGLKDKTGKRIWEGDIVKWGHVAGYLETPVRIAAVKINPDIKFITFIGAVVRVIHYGCFVYAGVTDEALEIIGNIHDNPELLKGGE